MKEDNLPPWSTDNRLYKIGYLSGLAAGISTAAFTIFQTLQLFRVFPYPYDEISIYGSSLCISVPFILEMLALHYVVPAEKKFWSHAALIFAVLYAPFVVANYIVQLATVIPMVSSGMGDQIELLKQTPHSLFWDFDAIGYIFMGFATLAAIPVFEKQGFQKWVRLAFIVHSITTPFIAYVYFYPVFSEKLLLLGAPWGVTAPAFMLLLAILFKRQISTPAIK
ncbi:hypothetical protein [Haliscomenobacter sp.]|uniref:hypothetical protein n=1 Tax=Haliscomenobacter sp. TaxID=2717303 RepID=UPI003BA8656A